MVTKIPLTRKELSKLTGAKPYQIYYLTTVGKLPLVHTASGRGDSHIYDQKAIVILNNWIAIRK